MSLMVWGCISAYSMGSLHVLEGTMNAERYIKALVFKLFWKEEEMLHNDTHGPVPTILRPVAGIFFLLSNYIS